MHITSHMIILSYGRIFCLEFQKIDGSYQRYSHYFTQILFYHLQIHYKYKHYIYKYKPKIRPIFSEIKN